MALSEFEIKRIEKLVGIFIEKRRPPAQIRDELDCSFRIQNQSFEILTIRPVWDDLNQKVESAVAKATYVKKTKTWKLYWMRANMKWHSYQPFPEAKNLEDILEAIGEDAHGCFWG